MNKEVIKDWRTTVIGIFAAIVSVLGFVGYFNYGEQVELKGFFQLAMDNIEPVITGITGIVLILKAKWNK